MRPFLLSFLLSTVLTAGCSQTESNVKPKTMNKHETLETATLAGGCFWCIEAIFEQVNGVDKVISGYTGGNTENPTYEEVCSGTTGHAEAVEVHFDPDVITYKEILMLFFAFHDPTTLNRQGADIGSQYRSAVFYTNAKQKSEAEDMIKSLTDQKLFEHNIVTQIVPLGEFYDAEDYHQNYFAKNPHNGYCNAVINPKVAKLRKNFEKYLK
jgi:peptide-methionine (S)-S-oxide reductase